ncbi:alcohol dehydrogenase zinc-binding domain-containing protein [Penicillium riverlandense]|uniref:alcohol dehydrogenase zinc-binding domain-containing protein n=1 Tax=Penicillium riverlandense TaxID=1903569 RepID=UPI002548584F|nr:alcohol dehydrogenase zinc-binding domain-containing protein [Penicillium riverlandense]KAJ5833430.1 alcohol dehydrogenase zinc-binding domain-containing protein [Penicillium riverlandense]
MAHQIETPARAPALIHDTDTYCLRIEDLPVPGANSSEEHLVLVKAVALTNGELRWPEPVSCSPAIPGYEVSGSVISAPAGSPFPVGSEVYARTSFDRQGNARQYSLALTRELGHKPKNISWSQAATVPLSALTAWQALFVHGGFALPGGDTAKNATKRILITAASGGVGIWAIQLARLAGIGEIIGTCGPANLEFVKSLGAHEAVDYRKHKDLSVWVDSRGCDKFDVVIDGVGEAGLEQALMCVKERGLLISIVTPPHTKKPHPGVEKEVNGLFFIVEADSSQLREISGLLERGECRAVVDSEYRLEDYMKAFEKLQGGHLTGKVVLNL